MEALSVDGNTASPPGIFEAPALEPQPWLAPLQVNRLVWLFVALGVTARLVRYALRFPLWCDEYQLAANFLDRDFAGLLRPLDYGQVAPLGFLWIEEAAIHLFHFNEWSLRLFPMLCAVASVFLFAHVARRLLTGLPLVLAVAVFSVSYYPIRLGAEVKPYACDLFASLVVIACAVEWLRASERSRWLWVLAVAAPLCMSISFPVVFVLGGTSLALLTAVWSRRQLSAWAAYALFNLGVAATFLLLMQFNVGSQYQASQKFMTDYWATGFPPLTQPLALAVWLLNENTSELFAHPLGAGHGGSTFSTLCCVCAAVWFWKRGQQRMVALFAGTLGLAFIAAALQRYPYGSHARLCQYATPLICLFVGTGCAVLVERIRRENHRLLAGRGALAALACIGLGLILRDVTKPYKSAFDHHHQDFARSVWSEPNDVETISLQHYRGRPFYTGSFETAFRCYREIYQDPDPADELPAAAGLDHWSRGAGEQTGQPPLLRCVIVHSLSAQCDQAVLDQWVADMQQHYQLAGTETHRIPLICRPPNPHAEFYEQCYDVYWFRPKPEVQTAAAR